MFVFKVTLRHTDTNAPRKNTMDTSQMPSNSEIVVAFFGITRSLGYTIDSINENVLDAARSCGATSVCCHFFRLIQIKNGRTSESGALDPTEYKLLNPDRVELTEPDVILADIGFDEIKAFGDHWKDGFKTVSNLLHQLYSIKRVTALALEEGAEIVAFCRPDLRYHDSMLDGLRRAQMVKRPTVLLPRWQRHKGGFNDRFAICVGRPAIKAYGNRLDEALQFCRDLDVELHSERLIRYALSKSGVHLEKLNVRASRIRSDGRMVEEDFSERSWKMLRNSIRFQRIMLR